MSRSGLRARPGAEAWRSRPVTDCSITLRAPASRPAHVQTLFTAGSAEGRWFRPCRAWPRGSVPRCWSRSGTTLRARRSPGVGGDVGDAWLLPVPAGPIRVRFSLALIHSSEVRVGPGQRRDAARGQVELRDRLECREACLLAAQPGVAGVLSRDLDLDQRPQQLLRRPALRLGGGEQRRRPADRAVRPVATAHRRGAGRARRAPPHAGPARASPSLLPPVMLGGFRLRHYLGLSGPGPVLRAPETSRPDSNQGSLG